MPIQLLYTEALYTAYRPIAYMPMYVGAAYRLVDAWNQTVTKSLSQFERSAQCCVTSVMQSVLQNDIADKAASCISLLSFINASAYFAVYVLFYIVCFVHRLVFNTRV